MKVGDLVRTIDNGAGVGKTYTPPGVICFVTNIEEDVPINPDLDNVPTVLVTKISVLIPTLGVTRTFHSGGLEVICEAPNQC